jgi:hypothetical protein
VSINDLFWAADWDGLYRFLAAGNPPLALQLLVLNTIFLIIYIVRRKAAKNRLRNQTVEIIQLFLLMANIAVVLQEDMLKWIGPLTWERFI